MEIWILAAILGIGVIILLVKQFLLEQHLKSLGENFVHFQQTLEQQTLEQTKQTQNQLEKNSQLFQNVQTSFANFKIETLELFQKLSKELQQTLLDNTQQTTNLKTSVTKELNEQFKSISQTLDTRLIQIHNQVQNQLATSFKELNELFKTIENNISILLENNAKNLKAFKDEQNEFKLQLIQELHNNFKEINKLVQDKLSEINAKVNETLDQNFKNINDTFGKIVQGIAKIAEAQRKIEELSTEVVSLQHVLTDKKTRGIFGEVQLKHILELVFGDNQNIYKMQPRLSNGATPDAIVFVPNEKPLPIDAKFPLENYERMLNNPEYSRHFKQDVKKHINDIHEKYVRNPDVMEMAILFLPAEAIFAEIHARHPDLIHEAGQKKVWLASPTTLMALLTTISALIKDAKTKEYAQKIQEELIKLAENFRRYRERWEKLAKHIETVNKDVKDIHTTTKKISNQFEDIKQVKFLDK